METFFNRFDLDRDGVVTAEEFGGDPQRFERLDLNGDGKIDRRELAEAIARRMEGRRGAAKSGRP
jgi:Ca2+-binding EF-hand superfamily protein